MTLGEHITTLRKKKSISQNELAKAFNTSGDIIGRYETNEVKPCIEVVMKIADTLEVCIDFLVGKSSFELDKNVVNKIQDIQKMDTDTKGLLFNVIDTYSQNFKTKQAFAK
jgi:transcriptional regulator with XRE-family HTH domain